MSPLVFVLILENLLSLNPIRLDKIRNPNLEARNKFEYQMNEIQNRLEHLNLCFLKIVSDFEFRASDFRSKAYNLVKTIKRFQIYQILSDTTLGER